MASSWTTDDLVAVERAIASGNSRVQIGDRAVQKYSLDDLLKIRAMIADSLAGDPGANGATRIVVQYVSSDKGLL